MHPVLLLLIIVATIILWFAISFIFIPLGSIIYKKVKEISNIINYEEEEEEKEKENE